MSQERASSLVEIRNRQWRNAKDEINVKEEGFRSRNNNIKGICLAGVNDTIFHDTPTYFLNRSRGQCVYILVLFAPLKRKRAYTQQDNKTT